MGLIDTPLIHKGTVAKVSAVFGIALVGTIAYTGYGTNASPKFLGIGERPSFYYAVYPAGTDPDPKCMVDITSGAVKVDDSCCTAVEPGAPFLDFFEDNNCISRELGVDGTGVRSYFGCDGGQPTFGEFCIAKAAEEGLPLEQTGMFKAGTDWSTVSHKAATFDDCGCYYKVTGPGCWKMNDFDQVPLYKDDTRRFFLYMSEAVCPA